MRTTLDIPDPLFKKAKLHSLREGVSLKDWVVARLESSLGRGGHDANSDAAQFRRRFSGSFSAKDIDLHKKSGRA
jgi:hypothetical protein